MIAGTDIERIQKEWGSEFTELDMADDWELVQDVLLEQLRWVTIWEKIVRHKESGLTIGINYPRNAGDGESADAYDIKWYEVEPHEKTVIEWRAKV